MMQLRIDPELKYCPQCKDEYRAEIETCAACDIELLAGIRMQELLDNVLQRRAERSMDIKAEDELVTIRKGPALQIKQLQTYLKNLAIPSLAVVEGDAGCNKGCCGTELLLRVRMNDAQEVVSALEQEHRQSTGLADHDISYADSVYNLNAEEVTCPACGFRFATGSTTCPDCGLCFA